MSFYFYIDVPFHTEQIIIFVRLLLVSQLTNKKMKFKCVIARMGLLSAIFTPPPSTRQSSSIGAISITHSSRLTTNKFELLFLQFNISDSQNNLFTLGFVQADVARNEMIRFQFVQ